MQTPYEKVQHARAHLLSVFSDSDVPTVSMFEWQRRESPILTGLIDHTLLKPTATKQDIQALCTEALEYEFASVCTNGRWVSVVQDALNGSTVQTCSVVGFPLGAMTPQMKAMETVEAIENGADEIDMVISIGELISENWMAVLFDIKGVVAASNGRCVKVILETGLLTNEQKIIGALLSKMAGASFVKTSTGFAGSGATLEDVALLRLVVGAEMGVKASGGIRNHSDAIGLLNAGATRLGASRGPDLLD